MTMSKRPYRGLFILHEGVGSTIFNSQILEHVKMFQEFEILTFETFKHSWNTSKKNLKLIRESNNVEIKLHKGVNIYLPFAIIINSILLLRLLLRRKGEFDFIHARADYTTFLCILLKPFHNLPVIWDCRGDTVAELSDTVSRKNILFKIIHFIYWSPLYNLILKINSSKNDYSIFVSKELQKKFYDKKINSSVIPCLVSANLFYFDESLRVKTRKQFNYEENEKIFLYSGSMVGYQAIEENIKIFKEILNKDSKNRILIATSQINTAKKLFNEFSSNQLRIINMPFSQMNSIYNMVDFSILIRKNHPLNLVASPTKFGEYCMTGLPVIMNDSVQQSYEIGQKLNNLVNLENVKQVSNKIRGGIAEKAKDFFAREILITKYIHIYEAVSRKK